MSDLSAHYLKNSDLNTRFFKMFKGRVYQIHEFADLWVYQTPKAKNSNSWLYFPKGTTEDEVAVLVERSVAEKTDYVYKATKNTPMPASVKHHEKLIEMGCVM